MHTISQNDGPPASLEKAAWEALGAQLDLANSLLFNKPECFDSGLVAGFRAAFQQPNGVDHHLAPLSKASPTREVRPPHITAPNSKVQLMVAEFIASFAKRIRAATLPDTSKAVSPDCVLEALYQKITKKGECFPGISPDFEKL